MTLVAIPCKLVKRLARKGASPYLLPEPATGLMLPADAAVRRLREAFDHVLDDARLLTTSYSLRRAAATFADVAGLEWSERLALGGWREAIGSPPSKSKPNHMPAVYNADKLGAEACAKVEQVARFAAIDVAESPLWIHARTGERAPPPVQSTEGIADDVTNYFLQGGDGATKRFGLSQKLLVVLQRRKRARSNEPAASSDTSLPARVPPTLDRQDTIRWFSSARRKFHLHGSAENSQKELECQPSVTAEASPASWKDEDCLACKQP